MNRLVASFVALSVVGLSSPVFAGGKKAAGPKTEKACTEKGGTWNKKKKHCTLPDTTTAAPKTEEAAPAAPTEEAAPAEGAAEGM